MQHLIKQASFQESGFTLVELMIVVLIIGILVAIAIPIFTDATQHSKEKTCKSDIRIINTAVAVAAAYDNNTPNEEATNGGESVGSGALTVQRLVDAHYIKSLPQCPFGVDYVIGSDGSVITEGHNHE